MILALLLVTISALYFFGYVQQMYRYSKTKYKPNLYFGVTSFFFALAALVAILSTTAVSVNAAYTIFRRSWITLGILAFVFLNMFAFSWTRPGEKMRGVWIPFASFLAITFILWTLENVAEGIDGKLEFTLTSIYKAPYGLPLVETILALMAVMTVYPTYLFFRVAKDTKDSVIKIKSLLIGIGVIIGTTAYTILITKAIPSLSTDIYIPMILVGTSIIIFTYLMPRQIERILFGRAPASADSVESFVEKFFVYPVAPTEQTQLNAFSKALGLDHQQMIGRNILFEFNPVSQYEKPIQNLAAEASANAEPTVIFTRMGSAIHTSLKEQKAVKFFCLTQQVSVPKGLSENEMLLPANDTSLMLDVFDKTLKAHPESNINVVFDSLSDLVMSIGFEKTYRFMRYAIEMLTSPRITVMFLLNQTAHDPEVMSSLRSLFSNQISFGKDGIQPVKLSARAVLDGVS